MSEFIHKEDDLNDIINNMENEDAPAEEDVELFQSLKIETPFGNNTPKTETTPAYNNEPTVFTNTYSVNDLKSDELTFIGVSTKIESNITCGCNLELRGKIIGEVNVKGRFAVYGEIEGDIAANELFVYDGSKITGNVTAKNALVDSAINGNVQVESELKLEGQATIEGDITTSYIEVANGAIINGRLSIKR